MRFIRKEWDELLEALQSGKFLEWLKEKIYKLFDYKEGLRGIYLKKWASKFEKYFHLHFDGEFLIKKKNGVSRLQGAGGHNYLVKDKNIKIRKYLTEPIDDKPFDTLISVRYKNGQWIEKASKSSMFPKNWDITRVKEEIVFVYEEMIKSGKQFHPKSTNRYYISMNSEKTFKIKIEFDELGNITNAYPWLKN